MIVILQFIWGTKKGSHLSNPIFRGRIIPVSPLIIPPRIAKAVNEVASSSTWASLSKKKKKVLNQGDPTIISWFQNILKCGKRTADNKRKNWKRKHGIVQGCTFNLDFMYSPQIATFHLVIPTNSHVIWSHQIFFLRTDMKNNKNECSTY